MFVNCAHGKGIKFIREDLKLFAKTNIQCNRGVLFKSIILLNADFLTIDAQSALRRCIEQFSLNTRFFIIVQNKNKLLNPILSRFCEVYVPEMRMNGKELTPKVI
jgi:replication factor C small subunit